MTWTEYAKGLEENLADHHSRVQTGAYRALPSRRTYTPKPDGRQRPLGIAALEDKIVQAGVVVSATRRLQRVVPFSWSSPVPECGTVVGINSRRM